MPKPWLALYAAAARAQDAVRRKAPFEAWRLSISRLLPMAPLSSAGGAAPVATAVAVVDCKVLALSRRLKRDGFPRDPRSSPSDCRPRGALSEGARACGVAGGGPDHDVCLGPRRQLR